MAFKLLLLYREDRAETHMIFDWPEMLRQRLPDVEVRLARSEGEAMDLIGDVDAFFGYPTPELFSRAKRLRWVHSPQAGPDPSFYHQALVASDVVVTNPRGIFNEHISQHIMAYVLAFARNLHGYLAQQARREWKQRLPVVYLPEATALIVGAGGIGGEAARLCHAFGMRVLATDARRSEPPPGVAELHPPELLDDLLPRADFVINCAPETPATQRLFDHSKFALMKPGAFFITIGRGATTVLDDLNRALQEGTIAGAGLDVYETEPLPAEHPLWDAPGAILTPHVAADGPHLDDRRTEVFMQNCERFDRGEPLLNVVDKANWF